LVLKGLAVRERLIHWQPSERFVIAFETINVPLVSRLVEDFRVEALAPGRTRASRRVYYTPRLAMRLVHPIARAVFGSMFGRSLAALGERVVATRSP